jgi:hypothetical protein
MREGLVQTWAADPEMAQLADRHYSRGTVGAAQFAPNGRKLILRDNAGLVVFVWLFPDPAYRADRQVGFNCTLFRNESARLSSEIILEAELLAIVEWGPGRAYTYVDASRVASQNPGYCFKCAGWHYVGVSAGGKHLLEKVLVRA